MTELDNCFNKNLLIKARPERDLARKDLRQAEFFLKEAKELIEIDKYAMAEIALYNAYFHAARSLLFKDGIREKSHFCLARYVEGKYSDQKRLDIKFVEALDALREMRHEVQYGLTLAEIDKEELGEYRKICEAFIRQVHSLIK